MLETGKYLDCYVAFLDILGFRQLVENSTADTALLRKISDITTLAATPRSGVKQTSLGPCPMQVRAFSDSIVVFAPTNHAKGNACNPLAQLCFVVRYLHDRVLEMDACIRGGVTVGKMYWHHSWSDTAAKPKRGSRGALPITFGPGLNDAYDLESKQSMHPRILVDTSISNSNVVLGDDVSAWPLADHGMTLRQCFRVDPTDDEVHLDLLNASVVRSTNETMHTSPHGFTVTWNSQAQSTHASILQMAVKLADAGIDAHATCEKVRVKYEWLRKYCDSSTPK
jgi:hypothetical protein